MEGYYNLQHNTCLPLSSFATLLKGTDHRKKLTIATFSGANYEGEASYLIINGVKNILLTWTDGEGRKTQYLPIVEQQSNLKAESKVYYFLRDGRKVRKLYLYKGEFRSRYEFPNLYATQLQTKQQRERDRRNPAEPNRKKTYRGKLTPYGKKLKKYHQNMIKRWH